MADTSDAAPPVSPPAVRSTAAQRWQVERMRSPKQQRSFTKPEKAAIIISALGPVGAEPILREFRDEDVRAFARASSLVGEINKPIIDATIREFLAGLDDQRLPVGSDQLKEILASILSEDAIERILEDVDESDGQSIWEKLSRSEPPDLANFLMREHPQTIAVVLSRIRPDTAAKVLQRFELQTAEEVVIRMSMVSALSMTVMDAVKTSIEDDFLRGARLKRSKRKPDELIGSMFNFLPGDKRDEIFGALENSAPELAVAVQRKMFTFQDVPARLDRANVSVVLREIDNDTVLRALAMAARNAPEARKFFLDGMSRRLADQYTEQLDDYPPPSNRDGEEAQFQVVGAIKRLADRGEIALHQPEDEELPEL